jgi:succinate-semialdehyde dehydrogenase/glutarate-semialdehyde dehydrogenase
MPKGVLNIVTTNDPAAVGAELTSNPLVRKITFTGSTEVGRILMRQSAEQIKKVSFELGGNAPLIVFDDADLDAAVEGALASKYRNAGQTCVCANRIYVQDSVYDAFAAKFAEKVKGFKVGPGTEQGVVIGPLIDQQGIAKVESHVKDATAKGGKVMLGGKRHALGGLFFEPTVLTEVNEGMQLAREETFGPVAPLFRFKTEADVIRMANASEFGLAAYFFARDVGRVFRVAEALEAGIISVNTGIFSQEVAPFGGVKQSGIGREGSKYGIEPFLEVKFICLGGI